MSMILVDTREQNPLWNEEQHAVKKQKLDEGDYTTEDLLNKAHIERKSGNDLYGSILQGHERFRNEIQRANEKGIRLAVFVECPKETFIGKKFKGGFRLHCKPGVLRKIVTTIQDKYELEIVWCKDRDDLREKALQWFENQRRLLHKAGFKQHNVQKRDIPESSPISRPKAQWGG